MIDLVASINLRFEDDNLHLNYSSYNGENWEHVTEAIRIDRVPCRVIGGRRPYFRCECGRRVLKLHAAGRFRCHCYQLVHSSQYEDKLTRAMRYAAKIERRLGHPGIMGLVVPKPRGMWNRKHNHLLLQALLAEMLVDEASMKQIEKLAVWANNPRNKDQRARKGSG
jgi:hypothetical protein